MRDDPYLKIALESRNWGFQISNFEFPPRSNNGGIGFSENREKRVGLGRGGDLG